jgi:hypothetical protein
VEQLSGQFRQPIVTSFRVTPFDDEIAALDVAQLVQALPKVFVDREGEIPGQVADAANPLRLPRRKRQHLASSDQTEADKRHTSLEQTTATLASHTGSSRLLTLSADSVRPLPL